MASLVAHYENILGPITQGWVDRRRDHGVMIVRFTDTPEPGVSTLATLGLSGHPLTLKDRKIHQEFLISVNSDQANETLVAFLMSVAEYVLARGEALLRGEVVEHKYVLPQNAKMSAVYVTNPSPFSHELLNYNSDSLQTIFCLLVPVTAAEGQLIRSHGWRWFEEKLEEQNPNIWDLNRIEEIQCI